LPAALLACALFSCGAFAETGLRDPEFSKVPFSRWVAESKQSGIHWSVEIVPAVLSTHQRIIQRVTVRVDGRELEKRRGRGKFLTLAQFEDAGGHVWQSHTSIDLDTMHSGMQTQEVSMAFYAFVLPGDYRLSIAICTPGTAEHSVTRRKVHVAPLRSDPLPESWNGLPPVEFIAGVTDQPDVWYLPGVATRLHLPLRSESPIRLEVLLNTTPSQRASGSMSAVKHNMSVLIPALKVLSQIDLGGGSMDVALLDLTHRKVSFEQKNVRELNWEGIRKVFDENNPGIVDVHTLAGQWKMRKFFWDEVTRRLAGGVPHDGGARHVVVILSGPAFLEDQEPVETVAEANDANRRLFYIRYRTIPVRSDRPRIRPGIRPTMPPPMPNFAMPVDDLENTVAPLNARLFDATSAEQFRRILAAVMEQISAR
jgi:hypothetical protein